MSNSTQVLKKEGKGCKCMKEGDAARGKLELLEATAELEIAQEDNVHKREKGYFIIYSFHTYMQF